MAATRSAVERVRRHGLKFVDSAATPWRESVFFRNGTTGVEFRDEDREGFVVRIARLENGRMPDGPSPVDVGAVFSGYDLNTLLDLRAPEAVVDQPAPAGGAAEWASDLRAWADASVAALQTFAADVLDDDFRVFEELYALVRARRADDVAERSTRGSDA